MKIYEVSFETLAETHLNLSQLTRAKIDGQNLKQIKSFEPGKMFSLNNFETIRPNLSQLWNIFLVQKW